MAGTLNKLLAEADDDADLAKSLISYIADHEESGAEHSGIELVRQLLVKHGFEVPPPVPSKFDQSKKSRPGLMGWFRR